MKILTFQLLTLSLLSCASVDRGHPSKLTPREVIHYRTYRHRTCTPEWTKRAYEELLRKNNSPSSAEAALYYFRCRRPIERLQEQKTKIRPRRGNPQ